MKLSLNWLGDFLDWKEKDSVKIAERITVGAAEVDEVEVLGDILTHCCVGKVESIKKHPDADKLQLCDVKTDKGKKRVVCGGSNLRQGMVVAFAHVGATVRWHGQEMMTLEKTKIRGEESEGMICAAEELDLTAQFPDATERNIIDMGDDDSHVGKSLKEHFGLNDTVLHIDNHAITHRADLFSHIGFARECVALGLATWKKKPENNIPTFGKDKPIACKVDIPKLVPRYLACTIDIEGLGETPDWMKRRLEAVGYRSLNLPIDVTNYVAAEVGMPLHSFDPDDFHGTVHFRSAKKGEKITTLDGVERDLPEGAIVLSDDAGIFDLMGVMGGLRSSTKDSTKRIYLHSAVVDPISIRRTIIATGHRTDASTTYEKGIPRVTAAVGFYRALELLLEHAKGATISSALEEWGDEGIAEPISLSVQRVSRVLGADISEKEVSKVLTDLEFEVSGKGDELKVTAPPHRLGDISGSHDLIEEVGRIHGYDRIEPKLPNAAIDPPWRIPRMHMVRDALAEQGAFELVPLSFVGSDLLDRCRNDSKLTEVRNPIGEDLKYMQPSNLPRLLEHAEEQLKNVRSSLTTFSIGNAFQGEDEWVEFGMLVSTKKEGGLQDDPFLLVKQKLSTAFKDGGYDLEISIAKKVPNYAHPGRCADIVIQGTVVGQLFEVHPTVRANFDLPGRAAGALMNLELVFSVPHSTVIAESIPEFPEVSYDVTVSLDQSGDVGGFLEKIRKSSDLMESVEVVDLYSGKSMKKGEYSLTLRCTYRAGDRTLTEEEARGEFERVEAMVR